MKNRVFAAALLLAAVFFAFAARPASAAPALWVVQSPAGKVYLFGTVHVLRGDTQWRSQELEDAIKASQDLYLEIANIDDQKTGAAEILKIGVDRGHPLSTEIPKADVTLLDKIAKQYGYPGEVMFEPMRPWLAFMVLSTMPALHSGYAAGDGADLQIRKEFATAGKPVRGFETFDSQAHLFADMPQTEQVTLLEAQLKQIDTHASTPQLNALVNAWSSGDEDKLETAMDFDKMQQGPMYRVMLANRNEAWANALAARLKQPGTSFVAVGAAHMLGADGVPALLQKMGFTVTRVEISQSPALPAATPQPSPSAAPSATASPTPAPSETPIPRTLTAPQGWTPRKVSLSMSGFTADMMWADLVHGGVLLAGHLDSQSAAAFDLDTFDAFLHQGLVAGAGAGGVAPSKRVKVCGGKQDGVYEKVTFKKMKEDIVLALSDRAYLAEYVRNNGAKDDPAALRSLLTLCAP